MQKVTTFADEQIEMAQAQLITMGGTTRQVEALIPRLLDVATAQKQLGEGSADLRTVTTALGKAMVGNYDTLSRLGIQFSETEKKAMTFEKLLDALDKRFGGMATGATKTYEGQLALLRNQIGEVQEAIGAAFIPMLVSLITKIRPMVERMAEWLSANKEMIKIIAGAGVGGMSLIVAVSTLGWTIGTLPALLGALTNPIGLAVIGLIAIATAITLIVAAQKQIKLPETFEETQKEIYRMSQEIIDLQSKLEEAKKSAKFEQIKIPSPVTPGARGLMGISGGTALGQDINKMEKDLARLKEIHLALEKYRQSKWGKPEMPGAPPPPLLPEVEGPKVTTKMTWGISAAQGLPPNFFSTVAEYEKSWDAADKRVEARHVAAAAKRLDAARAPLIAEIGMRASYEQEWLDAKLALAEVNAQAILDNSKSTASERAEAMISKEQEIAEAQMEHQDAVLEHWMETHELEMAALDALSAGYDTLFETILDKEMTGKTRREMIWKSMQQTFVRGFGQIMKWYLTEWLKSMLTSEATHGVILARMKFKEAKLGAVKAYQAFAAIPIVGPVLGAAAAAAAFAFLMAFHKGGLVGPAGNQEVVARLEQGEYVTRRRSVTPETLPVLRQINATGRAPEAQIVNLGITVNAPTSGEIDTDALLYQIEDELVPALEDLNRRRRFRVRRVA